MSRKLYLALHAHECSFEFSAADFATTIEREWVQDTGDVSAAHDEGVFDRHTFEKSWFELADVNTDDVDADEYARFLRKTTAALVLRHKSGGVTWRTDAQLLDDIRTRIGRFDLPIFTTRRRKWEAAFPEGGAAARDAAADGSKRRFGEVADYSLRPGDTRNWPRLPIERMNQPLSLIHI